MRLGAITAHPLFRDVPAIQGNGLAIIMSLFCKILAGVHLLCVPVSLPR